MITLSLVDIVELKNGISNLYSLQSEDLISYTISPYSAYYRAKISRKSDCKWFIGYWQEVPSVHPYFYFPITTSYPNGDYGDFSEIVI